MGLYKVNVLGLQGQNQKVYTPTTTTKYGQGVVSSDMFPEGNAEVLVKSGHLVALKDKELSEATKNAKESDEKVKAEKLKKEALTKALNDANEALTKGLEELKNATDDKIKESLTEKVEDLKVEVEVAKENLAEFNKK